MISQCWACKKTIVIPDDSEYGDHDCGCITVLEEKKYYPHYCYDCHKIWYREEQEKACPKCKSTFISVGTNKK